MTIREAAPMRGEPGLLPTRRPSASARPARARARVVRLSHMWTLLPIAAAFTFTASFPIRHADLFYMVLNGRLIAELGQFPLRSDPFTYAPADPIFFNQPWLAQLGYWAAERLGGYTGIITAHAVALTAAFALLGLVVRRAGVAPLPGSLLVLLALLVAGTNLTVRPQSFALLPFVACLGLLLEVSRPIASRADAPASRAPWRAMAAMAALTAVWSNLHGSFTLGPALAGSFAIGAALDARGFRHPRVRALAGLFAAAVVGSVLNPAGPAVWWYALRAGADLTNRLLIQEWLPPSLDTLTGQVGLAAVIAVVGAFAATRRRPSWERLVPLLAFGVLGVSMQRAVLWWGLVAAAVLAAHLVEAKAAWATRSRGTLEVPALNVALVVLFLAASLASLPAVRPFNPLLPREARAFISADHPTGAAAFLEASGARGRLFARMEWGGYLAWLLWPDLQVFLDARIEQHPPEVWRDYRAIMLAEPGWSGLLDRYGADYLLLERQPFARLAQEAAAHPAWTRVYEDELSVLFRRSGA